MNKTFFLIICLFLIFSVIESKAQTWYENADERIEQIRKGDFSIKVTDEAGNLVTDSISVELKKHEFPWGVTVPIPGWDNSRFQLAAIKKLYNAGVWGNEFKWPWIEDKYGKPYYNDIEKSLQWAEKVDFEIRGHTLLWGGKGYWQMPSWATSDTTSAEFLYRACEEHIRREMGHFKGRIHEYDVLNEPSPGHETWLSEKVGDSIKWNCFKWAHEADPEADLYVNEYNAIIWGHNEIYKNTIKEMLDHGAPITGIGVQGHLGTVVNWEEIKTKIDNLAEFGIPIKVTEFSMEALSEEKQAIEYAKMMRTIFSHPATNGLTMWGLNSYTSNNIPKLAADTIYNLVHNIWSTKLNIHADVLGNYNFRGFYGTYIVKVKFGNEYRQFEIPAVKANADSVFSLNYENSHPLSPTLSSTILSENGKVIRLTFDLPIDKQSIHKNDFFVVAKDSFNVLSIEADNENLEQVNLELESPLHYREYATVIYDGVALKSVNGGVCQMFGPETVQNLIPGFRNAYTDSVGGKIYLELSENMEQASLNLNNFQLLVNNSAITLTGAILLEKDAKCIVFEVSQKIHDDDFIFISYTNGSAKSKAGYSLENFEQKFVENKVINKTDLNSLSSFDGLRFYPNPNHNKLFVEQLKSEMQTIEILRIDGSRIDLFNVRMLDKFEINTTKYPQGILIVKVTNMNNEVIVKRIISENR